MKLTLLFLLYAVLAEQIHVFVRQLEEPTTRDLGTIHYDRDANTTSFHQIQTAPAGQYCIGTHDLKGKDCFVYSRFGEKITGEFRLFVDGKGTIRDLTYVTGDDEISAAVHQVSKGPAPVTAPISAPQKQQPLTQKVVRKRLVENEAGEKVEIEEEIEEVVEVDERSWVQKNWVYLVVPLMLFLILTPADK